MSIFMKIDATLLLAQSQQSLPFKMNGVSDLKQQKYYISRFTHHSHLIFQPIDAEYTILYTLLRGSKALSVTEKKLFKE